MFGHQTIKRGMASLRILRSLRGDDRGAMAVEYGLLVALVILSIFLGIELVASGINDILNQLTTFFKNAS